MPVDAKGNTYIDFKKEIMIKILNLKLVIMSEFLNTKIFLLKDAHQTGLKKFLLLVKLKIQFHEHVINEFNGEEVEELQNTSQKELRIEKVIKKRVINYLLNEKVMIVRLIARLIKKI